MKPFVFLTVMAAAWAGDSQWTSLGPDGGIVSSVVIDPLNPKAVYALTSGGMFKSTDGGANWRGTFPLPSTAHSLVFDPQNTGRMYAATSGGIDPRGNGAFKSTDGGANWRALRSGTLPIFGPLAIDPEDPDIVYAGGYNDILKSTDAGETWKTAFSGLPGVGCCFVTRSLVIDPWNPSTVYAVTASALLKSTNRGESWTAVYTYIGGAENPQFAMLAVDPQDPNTLYAPRHPYGGIYKSTDGGASWSAANSGLPGGDPINLIRLRGMAVDSKTGAVYVATGDGVFKSTDQAASWTKLDSQPGDGNVQALTLDPQDASTMYASTTSTGAGIHKTTDGGASWSAASSGIRAVEITHLAIAPAQPVTLYATARNRLLRSGDEGKSWNQLEFRYVLAIDPEDPATLFGWGPAGLSKSVDRGTTWTPANAGLPVGQIVNSMVIDPKDTRTAYAGVAPSEGGRKNGGIWKSSDRGTQWMRLDSQPAGGGIHGLNIDPNTGTVYAWNGMGLFESMDHGASWTKKSGIARISMVTIDPRAPGTLYAVIEVNCERANCQQNQSGIYKTMDSGESWIAMNSGLPTIGLTATYLDFITAFVIDSRNTRTLYAGTATNGVYRSTDGGATWSAVNSGLNTLNIHTLAIDPNINTVYAGTGGGLFTITLSDQ